MKYKTPCDSMTVEGLLRGAIVGSCWGVFLPDPFQTLDGYHQSLVRRTKVDFGNSWRSSFRSRSRNVGRSALIVSLFLGTFNAVSCSSAEFLNLEQSNPFSVFLGASSAGLVLNAGAKIFSPRVLFMSTIGTGLLSSSIQILTKLR